LLYESILQVYMVLMTNLTIFWLPSPGNTAHTMPGHTAAATKACGQGKLPGNAQPGSLWLFG
jgi:hypothetical protein